MLIKKAIECIIINVSQARSLFFLNGVSTLVYYRGHPKLEHETVAR